MEFHVTIVFNVILMSIIYHRIVPEHTDGSKTVVFAIIRQVVMCDRYQQVNKYARVVI